jgi:hypothetical protein
VARLVITATADADTAAIIDDLSDKAGANVAAMTRILMRSIGVWSDFPKAVHRAASWGQPFVLASFFRMSYFIATSQPTMPCWFSAF